MRTATFGFVLASFALASFGCSSGSDGGGKPAPRTVDPKSAEIRAAVQSNAAVALKLHSVLRKQPGNLFYSPLSIEAVLGMLYAGTDGDTATQIGELLDVVEDPQALHDGLGELLADLSGARKDRGYTLSLANRLWAAAGLDSSPDFIETTRDLYDAPMELADYSDPERVREDINEWVDGGTEGKIGELLKPGQLTVRTVMTVVNAIYFKADWANGFDPKLTSQGIFYRADGAEVQVPMMTLRKTKLRASSDAQGTLLELPYQGADIAFLAYVPDVLGDLENLEASLEASTLSTLIERFDDTETLVSMPRFSLRSRFDLIPTLKELGVVDLFDPNLANLTKIDTSGDLYVDPFVHEATVQVDESGTVAAAATAAGVTRKSGPPTILLDHPFLFFIRDNLTGAILFIGRVADPTAG
jgi:serine protease inhibitor